MSAELDIKLASIRIAEVASAYGIEIKERGLSHCVFHDDGTPSMSINPAGKYAADLFHCFGCGAKGDVVGFLARLTGVDRRTAVKALLNRFRPARVIMNPWSVTPLPECTVNDKKYLLDEGDDYDFGLLSRLRKISVPALRFASERQLLRFGSYAGERAWAITDEPWSESLQFRPMRPGVWFKGCKAISPRGYSTLGAIGSGGLSGVSKIHIVEGGPDLLAAHEVILWTTSEAVKSKVAAIAFLGASIDPSVYDVRSCKGRELIIWAHADKAGIDSANRKMELLKPYVKSCTMLVASEVLAGVKDLNDIVSSSDGLAAIQARKELFRV